MADDDAAVIPHVGKATLLIDRQQREVAAAAGARVPVVADLTFHLTHANRHLGMIEALRGMLELRGTATA